jgi:hypothetical protein
MKGMKAAAIAPRASGEVLSVPPISGVRKVPRRPPLRRALAELHALAYSSSLAELARECRAIEGTMKVRESRTSISIESRPSLPPIDVTAGLGELLGARAREVTPIVSVREPSREEGARRALLEVGRAFPLIAGEAPRESELAGFGARIEVVAGGTMASVQGYVVPICAGAPPAGTRVLVSPGPHLAIYAAPKDVTEFVDELATGDDAIRAIRAVALGLLLLRRARDEDLPDVCLRVASALADLDPRTRNALVPPDGDDRASRALGFALRTLAVCEQASDGVESLGAVAAAAMLQPHLDALASLEEARGWLAGVVLADPRTSLQVVVANQIAYLRRGGHTEATSMHARLVCLACDPRRESRVTFEDGIIELQDHDLEEVGAPREQRETIEIPEGVRAAEGRTRLAITPLSKILAVACQRRLSGTLVVTEPQGLRHALVLAGGAPTRALVRAGANGDPHELEGHLRRITAMASLGGEAVVEFYAGCDLLVGMIDAPLVPCAPHAAVLAAARARPVLDQLRETMISVATGRRLSMRPTRLPLYAPTKEEAAVAARVLFDDEPLSSLGGELDVAIPLLSAAHLLKELSLS